MAHCRDELYALCLDLMGTLVHDPYREAVRAATGLELDAVQAVKNPDAWPASEIGEIDEDEIRTALLRGSNHPPYLRSHRFPPRPPL